MKLTKFYNVLIIYKGTTKCNKTKNKIYDRIYCEEYQRNDFPNYIIFESSLKKNTICVHI